MSIAKKAEKKVSELKSKSDIEKAQELINKEKQERAEAFQKEMTEVSKKYNCVLVPYGRFSGNQIETGINIVAN